MSEYILIALKMCIWLFISMNINIFLDFCHQDCISEVDNYKENNFTSHSSRGWKFQSHALTIATCFLAPP